MKKKFVFSGGGGVSSKIVAISAVLPKNVMDLTELSDVFGEKNVRRIIRTTGIHRVHVAEKNKIQSDYCVQATENLFKELNFDRQLIDGLIYVSESPDYKMPRTSAILQDRLSLSHQIFATDLNFGCSGFADGILFATALINSGLCRNILLLTGSVSTHKISNKDRSTKMIFGDGVSATLIQENHEQRPLFFTIHTDGSKFDKIITPAGGARIPQKHGVTDVPYQDEDGNIRTQENSFMDGSAVFDFVSSVVPKQITETIAKADLTIDQIDLFAVHQVNELILKYIRQELGISEEKLPISLENNGNTSSATIPMMLCNELPGIHDNLKNVIISGFGSGLSATTLIVDLSETRILKTIEC